MDAHIEITRQDAVLEIITHRARVEISTQRPRFRLRHSIARMNIDKRMPTMHLDRSMLGPALDIGPVLLAARDYYRNALQSGAESGGTLPVAGAAVLNLDNGKQAAVRLSLPVADTSGGTLDLSSLRAAEVNWDPGYLDINWTPGSFEMEWDVSSWVDIRVEPHYVEIRMVKYPDVKIRVIYDPKKQNPGGDYVDKYL
jgi:hypothetical protein